jgi:hypothetical protein
MKRNAIQATSWTVAALVAIASFVGLAYPGLYSGTVCGASREALLGQDAVSLLLLALFMPAARSARRSSPGGEIVTLGCLAYYAYAYGYYAFGLADTPLYLVYLAILGSSIYGFIFLAASCAPAKRFAAVPPRMPRVAVAVFLTFAAAFTGFAVELPPLAAAALALRPAGMKPAIAYVVTDLAILFPGMIIVAYLALRSRSEGLFFSGVLLVKTVMLMPAILAAEAISLLGRGELIDPYFDVIALAFLGASLVLAVLYFRSLPRVPRGDAAVDRS